MWLILYFNETGWSENQAHLPRDSHALRWRLTSDDQVEGRNIPWIGMDMEGIYLPKSGFPLFSYAEGSRNGQPKKGPSPTRRSAPGIGASLALGIQLLCSSTWIHNTGLLSWRGEERGQSTLEVGLVQRQFFLGQRSRNCRSRITAFNKRGKSPHRLWVPLRSIFRK